MARQLSDDRDDDEVPAAFGGGIVARVVDRAMANPAATGGLLVMALTASAIVVNATLLQSHDHARPNAARSTSHASPASAVPTPRPRGSIGGDPAQTGSVAGAAAAAPKPASVAVAAAAKAVAATVQPQPPTAGPDQKLVADTQHELARLGLYSGAVDGILGKRTQSAIATYQKAAGLNASGIPSAELLSVMRKPAPQPASPPGPAAAVSPPARSGPIPPALIPQAASVQPAAAKATPSASVVATAVQADAIADDTYRRAQLALNQAGYGPIPIDGRPGRETADAIRRFELDYGLPVTGQPNDAVMKRLIAIGALAAR